MLLMQLPENPAFGWNDQVLRMNDAIDSVERLELASIGPADRPLCPYDIGPATSSSSRA